MDERPDRSRRASQLSSNSAPPGADLEEQIFQRQGAPRRIPLRQSQVSPERWPCRTTTCRISGHPPNLVDRGPDLTSFIAADRKFG